MAETPHAAFDALAAAIENKEFAACKAVVTDDFSRGKELTQELFDGALANWEKDLGDQLGSFLTKRPPLDAPNDTVESMRFAWTYAAGEKVVMVQSRLAKADGEWKLKGLQARAREPRDPVSPGQEAATVGDVLKSVIAAVEASDFEVYLGHLGEKRGRKPKLDDAKGQVERQNEGCGGKWAESLGSLPGIGVGDDSLVEVTFGVVRTSDTGRIETGVQLQKADGAWKVTDIDVNPMRE